MKPSTPRDPSTRNFHFSADDTLSPNGLQSKFRANIRAIQLSRYLTQQGRRATPSEKSILAAYSGWGAMKEAFNEVQANTRTMPGYWQQREDYQSWEKNWGRQYNELRAMLPPDEWKTASESTLNAHYTSPAIIAAIWQAVQHLGFKGGSIIEPACGIGHFLGLMPESIGEASTVLAVEPDEISAQLTAQLYPQIKVRNSLYEETFIPAGSMALVIGNVPFGQTGPADNKLPIQFNLHNYFFAKSIEKLAPGGLMALITSAYTLDADAPAQSAQRRYIAERTEMVGAIRLPNNAFQDNAGTEVVTDIIFLRKPNGVRLDNFESFARTVTTETDAGDPIRINEYFVRHPEMVLGRHTLTGSMYREKSYTVAPVGNLREALDAAITSLPANVIQSEQISVSTSAPKQEAEGNEKELSYVLRDGIFYQVSDRQLERIENWSPAQKEIATQFISIRESFNELIRAELNSASDPEVEGLRGRINELYDGFVSKYGHLNEPNSKSRFLSGDPEYEKVRALENVDEKREDGRKVRVYSKSDIFHKRTLTPITAPTSADNIDDALTMSLAWRGRIDVDFISSLLGRAGEEDAVTDELLGMDRVFFDPETARLATAESYLSGNVRRKLEVATASAAEEPERFGRNVDALTAIQPEDVAIQDINLQLGSAWVPDDIVQAFACESLGLPALKVYYTRQIDSWAVDISRWGADSAENTQTYGTKRISGHEILLKLLNLKEVAVYDKIETADGKDKPVYNPVESELANQKARQLQTDFRQYCITNPDVAARLESIFNTTYNSYVEPKFVGAHLTLPGITAAFRREDHQLNAIWRVIQDRQGVIAHSVGFGKTFDAIISSMELRRLGIARKPCVVVENATIGQFADSFRRAYPSANILVPTEEMFKTSNRRRLVASIAAGDYDAVILAHSQFNLLPSRPESIRDYLEDQKDDLRAALEDAKRRGNSIGQRQIAQSLKSLETRIKTMQQRTAERQDDTIYFEELGVDFLLCDECHKFKKVPFVTKMERVKGLDSSSSERAMQMHIKVKHIQESTGGLNCIGLSGTPITNTLAESWNMTRLFAPRILREFQVETIDRFLGTFATKVTQLELNEANNTFRLATRLAKFTNGPQLIQFIRSSWDIQMDSSKLDLKIPSLKGGEVEQVVVPLSEQNAQINELMSQIYDRFEHHPHKSDYSYIPILLMQIGMAASIDPRLVSPTAKDDPNSLVNHAIRKAVEVYRESADTKGTQLIFSDRYRRMDTGAAATLLNKKSGENFATVTITDDDGQETESAMEVVDDDTEVAFNLYKDMRAKLIAAGVPPNEIAIVNDFKTQKDRKALFDSVNAGEVRFLFGSTDKMGTGVNVQERLIALHELDVPRDMTPASVKQRRGRGLRQGNTNDSIYIFQYGMQGTTAAGLNDRVARKERFIVQILSGSGVAREFDDPASALSISNAEMKAKLVNDTRVIRQVELAEALRQMKVERDSFYVSVRNVRESIAETSNLIGRYESRIAECNRVEAIFREKFGSKDWSFSGTGLSTSDRKEIIKRLDEAVEACAYKDPKSAELRSKLRSFTVNGVPCSLLRDESFHDHDREDVLIQIRDPENPSHILRSTKVSGGTGALRVLSEAADVVQREAELSGKWLSEGRTKLAKLETSQAEMPEKYDKDNEISQMQAEYDQITAELLEEGEAKRKEREAALRESLREEDREELGRQTPDVGSEELAVEESHAVDHQSIRL